MSSSTTELIKEKLGVVEFLRGYLELKPAGRNFKAKCPFHSEKTPSFMVSPERQSWHCFGCGIGGDIFGFLMRYENLEFGEALRVLAEKAGVELKRLNPAEYKLTGLLYEINEKTKDFFKSSLANYAPAKKYLAERGLTLETLEEFELGWAPNEQEALSMHLLNSGYSPDDLLRAGVSIKSERGLLLDRFRGRVMFPIHNHFGRVVGFTGRILPQFENDAIGKYVNSPETPIFTKSRLLYGLFKAKNFIREAGSVFLVEGQMDFLMSWQAGVRNVAATSGTALTGDHLLALRRLTEEMVLSFDSDEAGLAAAERAIDLAEENDFSVKVVRFGSFKDPAEAAQASADDFKRFIKEAIPAPEFYFARYLPREKVEFGARDDLKKLRIILAKLKKIASPIERGFWFHELSKRAGLDEKTLMEEADKIAANQGAASQKKIASEDGGYQMTRILTRRELIGERLLRAGAASGNYSFMDDCSVFLASSQQNIFGALKSGDKKCADPQDDEIMSFIVLGAAELVPGELDELKRELQKEYFKEKRSALASAVRSAEVMGDEKKLKSAIEELSSLQAPVFES